MATLLVAVTLAGETSAASAQSSSPLFTGRDAVELGAATAAAGLLSRLDVRIARAFADSGRQARHPRFHTASNIASVMTETVLMVGSAATYGVARASHARETEADALHVFVSVAGAASFIQVVRGVLGRARPYVPVSDSVPRDSDPYDFRLLQGFRSFDYRSFPSMHAMASFAAATALAEEMRVHHADERRIAVPLLYAAAALPPLSRMYLDEHWASDIGMGVFLGIYSGRKVVQYTHAHPRNPMDHWLVRGSISLAPGARPVVRIGAF